MFLSHLQSLTYIGVFLYISLVSCKKNFIEMLPEMFLLGNFLFSILWEANSRYIFPCYALMLPLAAIGWYQAVVSAHLDELRALNFNQK